MFIGQQNNIKAIDIPKDLQLEILLGWYAKCNWDPVRRGRWISLIVQLLLLVIQRKAERTWAYANMVSVIRYHLITYINLFKFLKNPDSDWEYLTTKQPDQLSLFYGGGSVLIYHQKMLWELIIASFLAFPYFYRTTIILL